MKRKIITLLPALGLLSLILILQSCGGGESTSTADKGASVDTNIVVDTKAHSDSKGVGKYTQETLAALDPAKAESGKKIFATKCASCHKPTEVKFVGPGLKGVTQRRTPEWILNMMTNPAEMIKSDPVAKQLYKELLTPMAFQNVNDADAHQILEYLRQNDLSNSKQP
ncbi:MAG: cytochrome c [Bacteroidota bacterium]